MKINKPLYYILNLTWGLLLTLVGALVALFLIIIGKRPKRHGGCWYFNVGHAWGGLEMGLFFLTDDYDTTSVKNHEYGHSLQNAIWGPLMLFVISIPSAIRYWVFHFRTKAGKPNPPYDSIWFEGQATRWGTVTVNQWQKKI